MIITDLPHFLRLTIAELAEVTELVLADIDLCIPVHKGSSVTNIDAEGIETSFDTYNVDIHRIPCTTQMDKNDEVVYQSILSIIGNKLATHCKKLRRLELINCNLGVDAGGMEDFFEDLRNCKNLTILNLADNALWGMSSWCSASNMFDELKLTDLDLSSNSLFDFDVWDELEEETQDYTETWSDILSALDGCSTLQTLNLANNNVENAIKYCAFNMTLMLTHMIVEAETVINLAGNKLTYLTSSNLQSLRNRPPESASESTAVILSQGEIKEKLYAFIEKEIKIHDEYDCDPMLFSRINALSLGAECVKEPAQSLKGNVSKTSLTTTESLSPLESAVPGRDITPSANCRRYVKVPLAYRGASVQPITWSAARLTSSGASQESSCSELLKPVDDSNLEAVSTEPVNDLSSHQSRFSFATILSSGVFVPITGRRVEKRSALDGSEDSCKIKCSKK